MREKVVALLARFIPENVEDKLKLRQILNNFSWLLGDKVLRLGLGVAVNLWIARYLGPDDFGILNYAIAVVAIVGPIATLGIEKLVIRDVVLLPEKKDNILGSAFYLRLTGSFLSLGIAFAAVALMNPGDSLRMFLVLIIAGGSVFQAFDIIDFWFQAKLLSRFTVVAKNTAFVIVTLLRVIFILSSFSVLSFAIAISLEYLLGAIGLLLVYRKSNKISDWKFNITIAKSLFFNSLPLLLTDIGIMIYMRIDQIMLMEMVGEKAVGIYSAAVRLVEVWYFIPIALVNSVFPVIIETKKIDEALYYRRLSKLYSAVTWMGLSVAVFVAFFADYIVYILYGNKYYGAGPILSISIWAGVFVFQGVARGLWIINENLQKYSYYFTFGAAFINVALNIILIPAMGGKGAAIATIISYFFSTIAIPLFIKPTRQSSVQLLKSFFWR
jgi:PST family polysaccharide transporter